MIVSTMEDCKQKSLYKLNLADDEEISSNSNTLSQRGRGEEGIAPKSKHKHKVEEPIGVRVSNITKHRTETTKIIRKG